MPVVKNSAASAPSRPEMAKEQLQPAVILPAQGTFILQPAIRYTALIDSDSDNDEAMAQQCIAAARRYRSDDTSDEESSAGMSDKNIDDVSSEDEVVDKAPSDVAEAETSASTVQGSSGSEDNIAVAKSDLGSTLEDPSDSEDEEEMALKCMLAAKKIADDGDSESDDEGGGLVFAGGSRAHLQAARPQESLTQVPLGETWETQPPLFSSPDTWGAKQRLRRASSSFDLQPSNDVVVVRTIKGILNKLTVERFDVLYDQLISCGIESFDHVELLIAEVFEKAMTQHHFIEMYADLCVKLHQFFGDHKVLGRDTSRTSRTSRSFRTLLLTACQRTFEQNLTPPANLATLDSDERVLPEVQYKTRMLGNLRFVAALLVRKMLAGRLFTAILDRLLQDATPETLESAAMLVTRAGASFDTSKFPQHEALVAVMERIEAMATQTSIPRRVRCLLQDVVDLRAAGWKERTSKSTSGPSTLAAVAEKFAEDEGVSTSDLMSSFTAQSPHGTAELKKFCMTPESSSFVPQVERSVCNFRRKADSALRELRMSHDLQEAMAQLLPYIPAWDEHADALCDLMELALQESTSWARQGAVELAVGLLAGGHFRADAMGLCMENLLQRPFHSDIQMELILKEELYPALTPLVACGCLHPSKQALLLNVM